MYDPIKMEFTKYTEAGRKRTIHLTHTENLLLYYLYSHKGKIISFDELSVYVLNNKLDKYNYKIIVTAKSRLTKKLKDQLIIVTYSKMGYMLTKLGE